MDAFGREIHDHYPGRNNCEVIERDDGCWPLDHCIVMADHLTYFTAT